MYETETEQIIKIDKKTSFDLSVVMMSALLVLHGKDFQSGKVLVLYTGETSKVETPGMV